MLENAFSAPVSLYPFLFPLSLSLSLSLSPSLALSLFFLSRISRLDERRANSEEAPAEVPSKGLLIVQYVIYLSFESRRIRRILLAGGKRGVGGRFLCDS